MREKSELLAALTNTELDLFESVSREARMPADQILFEEGGPADSFFIISEGRVGLELTSPGKTPLTIQTLGPGDMVGVSWFFAPYRWNWRARALVDTTLVVFDAVEIRRRCAENRDLDLEVLSVLAREVVARLQRTRIQLLDLYRND
jgi:CRP-like cAMP-binding protein